MRSTMGSWLASLSLLTIACSVGMAQDSLDSGPSRRGFVEVEQCVVRFAREVNVPVLESGRVAEVQVTRNNGIQQGAPIARLDDRNLLVRRRAAQLKLTAARTDSVDEIEIRYAKVARAEAEAELENSRAIQNDARGAIAANQLRRMRLAVERGELEVAQAEKRLKRAKLEADLLEADLAQIDDQLRLLHIESPMPGMVLEVMRAAGEWIEKGETIAKIGQIDRLEVHALIPASQIQIADISGLPVSVHWRDSASGENRSLRGTATSVDPQLLPRGQYRLHADIKNERLSASSRSGAIVSRASVSTSTASQTASTHTLDWMLLPGTVVKMRLYIPEHLRRSEPTLGRIGSPRIKSTSLP